jgi:hypothetical protein
MLRRRSDEQRGKDDRDEKDFVARESHFRALFT